MAMGVHHDNFDCWDSTYQPWNSVRVGPKVDIVGTWEKVARQHGLRFGIGFHDTPARTWGQFMPVRYTSDKTGPKKGVPYDALQTILDGKGKWWEGMDPVDLYGPVHTRNKDPLHSPFANQFMWRVDDAITKYHPDVIYFDEHAGDSQVDLGVHMGLGFLAPPLVANYYNKSLQWNHGKMDVVINLKGVGGRYNSFQNNPELLPFVDRSLVKSTEAIIEPQIMAYPFQTETSIADWHYRTGQRYMDARSVIRSLMQNVSRNGTMLLNITQHGRGDLDPQVIRICKDIGAWLKINGEAVYASRPFEVYGEQCGLLHAQQRQCLCHAPGLERRPDHSQGPARRRGDPGQSVQSRTARLRSCADVCSRRSGADGDARRTGAAAGRESPTSSWHRAAGSCASPMTRAGSMTTTRVRWLPDGFAAATWARATSTTTSPPATRPAMSGVVRLPAAASRSSPRKKQEPERSRFRLTAKPARQRILSTTGNAPGPAGGVRGDWSDSGQTCHQHCQSRPRTGGRGCHRRPVTGRCSCDRRQRSEARDLASDL